MSPTSKKVYPSSALSTSPPPSSANYVNNLKKNLRAFIRCPFVGRGVLIGHISARGTLRDDRSDSGRSEASQKYVDNHVPDRPITGRASFRNVNLLKFREKIARSSFLHDNLIGCDYTAYRTRFL